MKDQVLFPKIEVREKGYLQVSDIHTIYWERSGNPKGKKILVIHGGPGLSLIHISEPTRPY